MPWIRGALGGLFADRMPPTRVPAYTESFSTLTPILQAQQLTQNLRDKGCWEVGQCQWFSRYALICFLSRF